MADVYKGVVSANENVRVGRPSVNAKWTSRKKPGDHIEISHKIKGEMHRGSDDWYVLTDGSFMWAGVIFTPQEVPLIEKQLLITADDVGVVKEIDDGAKEALRLGMINSIAVFVNHPKDTEDKFYASELNEYLQSTRRVGSSDSLYDTSHIGLHYTILSGGPILKPRDLDQLVDGDQFRTNKQYQWNLGKYKSDRGVKQALDELNAQYEKFKRIFGREPDHLTSHYDILTFNKPLFEMMYKWASPKGIPIRSHRFLPRARRVLYDTFAFFIPDLPSIPKLDKWEKNLPEVLSPQNTIVAHYGPVPPFAVKNYPKQVRKKQEKLRDWMTDFLVSKDILREVVIHLMKTETRDQRKFKKDYAYLSRWYPGINEKQFDGRVAEYLSLEAHTPFEDPEIDYYPVVPRLVPTDGRQIA